MHPTSLPREISSEMASEEASSKEILCYGFNQVRSGGENIKFLKLCRLYICSLDEAFEQTSTFDGMRRLVFVLLLLLAVVIEQIKGLTNPITPKTYGR